MNISTYRIKLLPCSNTYGPKFSHPQSYFRNSHILHSFFSINDLFQPFTCEICHSILTP